MATNSNDGPVITAVEVSRVFGSGATAVTALSAISLTIVRGEFLAVTGRSGSGKTTLLNLLSGLDRPSTGTVHFNGNDLAELRESDLVEMRRHKIGFVFQAFHLLPGVSAFDNVMIPLIYCNKTPADAEERVERVLTRVGLEHRMDHTPGQLSGGEQQRVTIARSLINDPKILLADEPTGNLDSKNGAEIMAAFDHLNTEGRTIIIITHDPVVSEHARRILTLRDGQIVSDRINENFKESHASLARAAVE